MSEVILKIEESGFSIRTPSTWEAGKFWTENYDGFVITTDKQEIKVGVSSGQSCCESFGVLSSDDNFEDFIGAELKSVVHVDQAYKTTERTREELEYLDCGGTVFVNFETSKGIFQIVAYNSHNGYYGHDAVVISNQLSITESI